MNKVGAVRKVLGVSDFDLIVDEVEVFELDGAVLDVVLLEVGEALG